MLRFLTAGESHGKALMGILEGMPAGLRIDKKRIDHELARRQSGYGRGARMRIEKDTVEILSGTMHSLTIGSPIGLLIRNKDARIEKLPPLYCPRPGHGDLAGGLKYGFSDLRCVLERASARETAMRVAVGAVCKTFLDTFHISISSSVCSVCGKIGKQAIKSVIDEAARNRDSVGGIFEVVVKGAPVGLGSHVQWDRKLDALLAVAVMSIPAIKAVEIGLGFGCARRFGSETHDAIYYSKKNGYYRMTNNAGGLEAGISNGENIVIRACMKPIATLGNALPSVDIRTKKPHKAQVERYDTCAIDAAGIVAEAMVAFEIAKAFLEKFGSDSMKAISSSYKNFRADLSR